MTMGYMDAVITIDVAATGTSFHGHFSGNVRALLHEMIIVISNYTDNVTTTLTIVRAGSDKACYTGSALNRNTKTVVTKTDCEKLVSESDLFTLTLSAAAGAGGGTVSIYCQLIK